MKRMSLLVLILLGALASQVQASLVDSPVAGLFPFASQSHSAKSSGTTFGTPAADSQATNHLAAAFQPAVGRLNLNTTLSQGVPVESGVQRQLLQASGEEIATNPQVITSVPEPSVVLLLVTGLVGLALSRRRVRR